MSSSKIDIPQKMGILDHEFRLVLGKTKIDYDPNKEDINRKKHGYSLESGVFLLESVLLPIGSPPYAESGAFIEKGEYRHNHMGIDDNGKVVFMVTTMSPDETVRVISFRRASSAERNHFYELTGYQEDSKR